MNELLRVLSFGLGLWPEGLLVFWAHIAGALWFHVFRFRRRLILENMVQAFPDLGPSEQSRLGRAACTHLVRSFFEFLRIPRYRSRGLASVVLVEGLEHWQQARAKGKGVLCLSGHMGSFELCAAALADEAGAVSLVARPLPESVAGFVAWVREGSGLSVIAADGTVKAMLEVLGRNETVIILLDENATRSTGVFVEFFGRTACTLSGLAVIAERSGAVVIGAEPFRDDDGSHVLRLHPEIPFVAESSRVDTVQHMTQRYARFLQEAISRHPAQWFWTHQRWRTRPVQSDTDRPHFVS